MSWRSHGHDNASLVDALVRNGILTTPSVIDAMRAVDRGLFLSGESSSRSAYEDAPQRLSHAATISAPHMHGYCLELLAGHLTTGSKCLDVGSGSGYLTAVMTVMTGRAAIGVEHVPELVHQSKRNIAKWASITGRNLQDEQEAMASVPLILERDGFQGYSDGGPYKAIHVGAAAPELPTHLVAQLDVGGRLVVPVGTHSQELLVVDKHDGGRIEKKSVMGVVYVPLTSLEAQLSSMP